MHITKEWDSIRELVASVLEDYESARSNDTKLYLLCCQELGAHSMYDIEKLNLSIISVHKTRQYLQNKLGLFLPSDAVKEERMSREVLVRKYMMKVV